MTHTFKAAVTTFAVKTDFEGDVILRVPKARVSKAKDGYVTVAVPFVDLKSFIAEYVRQVTLAAIEELTPDGILFGTEPRTRE